MKRLILMVVTLILSGVLAMPGFAEITPGRVSVSPFAGLYTFDDDMQLKNKPVYGLRLGYDHTERWGWEGAVDAMRTNPEQASSVVVDVFGARLDVLYHFWPQEKLVPFLAAGAGGTIVDNKTIERAENNVLFNYGGGVKYFLTTDWALRADIRHLLIFEGNHQNRQDWEYTFGIAFLFGGKKAAPVPVAVDSDGDGVLDSADRCPGTPKGEKVGIHGCPLDSDGDGVLDSLDKCPDTPKGEKVGADGCPPDSDGDGVLDSLDKCPDTPKGEKVGADGCPPDSDGDGVLNSLDKCPDTPKGEKVGADGCPLDTDGDGVLDSLDKCQNTPKGVRVDKNGCQVPERVSIALEVEFDSGKADIKQQYHEKIKKVADFMASYPETTAAIEGHTDNVGKESSNLRLSTRRAESVRTYLIEKFGIAPERLIAKGFGSTQPEADNATPEGRQQNRRITAVIEAMKIR